MLAIDLRVRRNHWLGPMGVPASSAAAWLMSLLIGVGRWVARSRWRGEIWYNFYIREKKVHVETFFER
jgi:hypothetical protein